MNVEIESSNIAMTPRWKLRLKNYGPPASAVMTTSFMDA